MKSILLVILMLASFGCWSQTQKGSSQFGLGGLPIVYFDNSLPTGYSLRANVGFFVMDQWSVGIMPFTGKVDDIRSFGASLYSRYYLLDKKLSLFIEGSVGFGRLTYENQPALNGFMSSLTLGPGLSYRLKENIQIELLPQYARLRNETNPADSRVGNTFIPTLGIQFFIP